MKSIFKPNLEMADQFFDQFGDKFNTFQTFSDKGARDRNISQVFHGPFAQYAEQLAYLNALGAGIFFMVNKGDGVVHDGKRTCRTNANIVEVRALFVDADGAPLEPILENSPPPHIVVESSPGKWHVYWLTNDTEREEFKVRQQALAEKFGTDPAVCDLARVMRIPGFYHQKGEPFMTRLVLS